jgi:hypothetical protein
VSARWPELDRVSGGLEVSRDLIERSAEVYLRTQQAPDPAVVESLRLAHTLVGKVLQALEPYAPAC